MSDKPITYRQALRELRCKTDKTWLQRNRDGTLMLACSSGWIDLPEKVAVALISNHNWTACVREVYRVERDLKTGQAMSRTVVDTSDAERLYLRED